MLIAGSVKDKIFSETAEAEKELLIALRKPYKTTISAEFLRGKYVALFDLMYSLGIDKEYATWSWMAEADE